MTDSGKIELETMKTIELSELTENPIHSIPSGGTIELIISFDENEFISGKNGIIWATYSFRQAEIISNALISLHINCEIKKKNSAGNEIYLIKATDQTVIDEAIDFIWKSKSGLQLKPDWNFPKGESNNSFQKWLSEQ